MQLSGDITFLQLITKLEKPHDPVMAAFSFIRNEAFADKYQEKLFIKEVD